MVGKMMNKRFQVIWSEARNCYVVVSEIAGRNSNAAKAGVKRTAAVLGALCLVSLGGANAVLAAADTTPGAGSGVAIGTGSNAPKAENVAIGKGAGIAYSNGASNATGDIVVGNGANINNYASQGGSIAIGKNAKVWNMAGGGEASFAFGQTTYSGNLFSPARIPEDPTKVVGSIAIGDNTFARTGSTMIGSHNYRGELGDTTVDSATTKTSALNVYATTIGANSFSNGAFTTSTGVYNIISSNYNGGRLANPVKNLGATINGSLNSIESMNSDYYSGIANTVSGVANRTFNANGALVYGAGNEITNSVVRISSEIKDSGASAKEFADKLRKAISDSEGGGATLAIGGGNKADYTQKTSIIGVNNTVTGTSGAVSTYNSITGFKNTATNVKHVTVFGSENTVTDTEGALVLGDKRTANGADGSIILGSSAGGTTTSVKKAVVLGAEADVLHEGGVALGADSKASIDKGVAGYDPDTQTGSTDTGKTWTATAAAVSVGDTANNITRQITNVAAGYNDTDAVNVAQLKKAMASAGTGGVARDTRNTVQAGTHVQVDETPNADGSSTYTVSVKADGKVENGNTGIVTGGTVYNETRTTADGTYTKVSNTAGENIMALDTQVKQNTDAITNVDNRVTNLDNRMDRMDGRIDRVGAGAAALAALHPQDFDVEDKWDFAAGYGHYRSANAMAVGAFYRPDAKTMVSVGGSMGGGENLLNVGVSLKFGKSSPYAGSSKAALASVIEDQKKQLDAQDGTISDLKSRNAALSEKVEKQQAQIEEILRQLAELKK